MMLLKMLSSLTLSPPTHLTRLCITTYIALDNLVVKKHIIPGFKYEYLKIFLTGILHVFHILMMYINNSKEPER